VEPAFTIVTVLPEIVAVAISELVYENVPVLLEDGSVRLNEVSPYFLGKMVKLFKVGTNGSGELTVSNAVIVPDV
jgi:hypothetical protein